jgi:alkylhydroperoxidase family enzyme
VEVVLEDYRAAPIGERLRTTLAFLEKLTLSPGEVGPADIAPMRAAGVSDRAVEEAVYVATMFNIMDRFADAFDFEVATGDQAAKTARILLKLGYGIASVPG